MLFHSFILWPAAYGSLVPGAYITVNMFFVLSGFLITSLLLEERARNGRTSYKSFYQRRALRLLPALLLLLSVHLLYTILTGNPLGPELAAIGWISAYASNWAQWAGKMQQIAIGLTWGHTWTLAVEEQFYIVWPLLLVGALAFTRKLRTLAWWLVGADRGRHHRACRRRCVGDGPGPGRAGAWNSRTPSNGSWASGPTCERTRCCSGRWPRCCCTAAGGRVGRCDPSPAWRSWRSSPSHCSCNPTPGSCTSGASRSLISPARSCASPCWIDGWRPSSVFWARPSAWLGRLSYALYLWHPPVFVAVIQQEPTWPIGLKFAVAWAVTFACAITSYYCVETPFLKLKARLSDRAHGPSERSSGTVAPAAAS